MQSKSITFNRNGGPITVTVSAGQAQPGSYVFRLWEANTNQTVLQEQGNFLNDADDSYKLPEPNSENNGRMIQGILTVAPLPPNDNYSGAITVVQDGKTIGEVSLSGSTDQSSVTLNLYATLTAAVVEEVAETNLTETETAVETEPVAETETPAETEPAAETETATTSGGNA